jgi:hypothetical protein
MYYIQALVAPCQVFIDLAETHPVAVVQFLPQDFCLVPIMPEFLGSLAAEDWARRDPPTLPAPGMGAGTYSFAENASHRGPVAFVTAEYFGGAGGQDAVVWRAGKFALSFHDDESSFSPWPDSAISKALREIGAKAAQDKDEFDTLGLGNRRSTEAWAASSNEGVSATALAKAGPKSASRIKQKPWWKFWR